MLFFFYFFVLFNFFLDIYKILEQKDLQRCDRMLKANPQLLNTLRDSYNCSLLMTAARNGERNLFSRLLDHPQDISITNSAGLNIFHCIATHRNEEWWFDEVKRKINNANELKELLDKKNRSDWTPLHCAARSNNHRSIKWLLTNAADVNTTDNGGRFAGQHSRCDDETKRIVGEHRNK